MALNWSLVIFLICGFVSSFSTIRTIYRLATGHEYLNFTQIVAEYGYQGEHHIVQTEDGYLLTIFRIPEASNCTKKETKSPVLLMTGLLGSADSFLDPGVDVGLPFLISDACYDVWVGNVRGTYYGRKHITLNPDDSKEFWDFSIDEMGMYDIPATINYVLSHTGATQLNFIGVSQGAGSFLIMCSERPGYCNKAKLLIALAPAAKVTHCKSIMFRTLVTFFRDNNEFLQSLGFWEVFWQGNVDILRLICQYEPKICEAILGFIDAPHLGSYAEETLKAALDHFPAGTSTKNLARYGQSVNGQRFSKYDYGREKNIKIYESEVPPDYNLRAVTVPSVVIYGKNDALVVTEDVNWLASQLPNMQALIEMEDPLWNHLDMVIAKGIPRMLLPKIMKYLQLYNSENLKNVTILPMHGFKKIKGI